MHAFGNDLSGLDELGDSDCPRLPNIRIMPATKVADCGVSSQLCRRSYHIGLPLNMHVVVQEMGCIDCNPLADLGDNRSKNVCTDYAEPIEVRANNSIKVHVGSVDIFSMSS